MHRPPLKHCRDCGTAVILRLPDDGDTKERAVCPACKTVHYENPLNVVGTVPIWEEDGDGGEVLVLLCKRNIEPRKGKWTLPLPKVQPVKPMKKQARSLKCRDYSAS